MVASTTITTPQTLLEAINLMLRQARVARMQTMDAVERSLDASEALAVLNDVVREVLLRGWEFNTEREYKLTRDGDDRIVLPTNALKVTRAKYQSSRKRLFVRQRKLYDNGTHSFVLTEDALVDMIVALPFEDLPEVIKHLVAVQAAYRWAPTKLPSGAVIQLTSAYVQECESAALQAEVDELGEETLQDTSPHFAYHAQRRRPG